jgi:xylose isomerase
MHTHNTHTYTDRRIRTHAHTHHTKHPPRTQTGWDTDQFLTDPREAALIMLTVVRNGGLGTGGFNFDAKLRWGVWVGA